MPKLYEVQTRLLGGRWENVTSVSGELHTLMWDTYEEAEAELKEHLGMMDDAGMDYNPDDYRIAEVE